MRFTIGDSPGIPMLILMISGQQRSVTPLNGFLEKHSEAYWEVLRLVRMNALAMNLKFRLKLTDTNYLQLEMHPWCTVGRWRKRLKSWFDV